MDLPIFLHAFTSFIVIIDPIGSSLMFNSLTTGKDRRLVVMLAVKSILVSILVVTLFALFGESLFNQLGIRIESLRVAGGILLFWTAFNLITASPKYKVDMEFSDDIYVYPMAIPFLAGPGALTVTVLLFSGAKTTVAATSTAFALGVSYCIALASLIFAGYLSSFLGRTGNDVIRRLMGVLLAALAIQFVVDGIKQLFNV